METSDFFDDEGRLVDIDGLIESLSPLDISRLHEALTDFIMPGSEAGRIAAHLRVEWLIEQRDL